jgi:hypothetical protein
MLLQGLLPVHVPHGTGMPGHEADATLGLRPVCLRHHVRGHTHLPPEALKQRHTTTRAHTPATRSTKAAPHHHGFLAPRRRPAIKGPDQHGAARELHVLVLQ